MSYITQTDIENVFGSNNVISWSNLDNDTTTANTTRIAEAITYAEGLIDDKFRGGPYALPFSPVPAVVKDWAAKLAGLWLYDARGHRGKTEEDAIDKYAAMKGEIENQMAEYAGGARKFSAARAASMPNSPVVVE
ncbi:MAG: DUF1320 family protein [Planctomycetes bacterium]|nr:DUF1320 family protein [Planctomycetota bacterium]